MTSAPEETWICALCGAAVDPTTSLYLHWRPGRRALIWHPACPAANDDNGAAKRLEVA